MKSWELRDDRLLAVLEQADDALWLTVQDLAHGKSWPKAPLLVLDVHNKPLRRTSPVAKYRIDLVERARGGLHVVVGDNGGKCDVGLWLRIENGELVVTLSPAEVYDRQSDLNRLFAIDILPGLMNTGPGGAVLLPINTGVQFDPAGKGKLSDRFLIYGEQDRWELMPSFPICAAYAADGGMLAIATEGASDAECRVGTDGAGQGNVGFAFSLKKFWPDTVDMDRRVFRFAPIPPDADPVVFVAKRLRRHVIDDLGKPTLTQRKAESPELAYLLEAYIMKMFHGIENEGYMMGGHDKSNPVSFVNCMTFEEAGNCLKMLHDAGVPKVLTQSVGWNMRGHDGAYPTRFPIEERVGGEEGFREMIALGNSLGYNINVHDNFMMGCKTAPGLDTDLITQDFYGEPLIHGWWAGGVELSHWLPALPEERTSGHMQRMKGLGIRGMYYMDYMGQPLEVNYHPKHKGSRGDMVKGTRKLLQMAKEIFGSSACESGFLYNSIEADVAASRPNPYHLAHLEPHWPLNAFIEKIVPIYQIALHGLIVNENSAGPTWQSAIQTVLFGDHPRDEWSVRPFVMPEMNETRARAHKAMYDLTIGRFGYLQEVEMMDHKEVSDGVLQTDFADGTVVTVNTKTEELFVNGTQIPRPGGFLDK